MTETVNALAAAVREGGGVVTWVMSRMRVSTMPSHFPAILGAQLATRYFNDGQAGGAGTRLWHALDRKPIDVVLGRSESRRGGHRMCGPAFSSPTGRARSGPDREESPQLSAQGGVRRLS